MSLLDSLVDVDDSIADELVSSGPVSKAKPLTEYVEMLDMLIRKDRKIIALPVDDDTGRSMKIAFTKAAQYIGRRVGWQDVNGKYLPLAIVQKDGSGKLAGKALVYLAPATTAGLADGEPVGHTATLNPASDPSIAPRKMKKA